MFKSASLTRRATIAARTAGVTAAILLALMAAEKLSPPAMAALRDGAFDPAGWAAAFVQLLPAAFFTAALWALRTAFLGVAAERPFTNELPRALRMAGWALAAGAATAVLAEPALLSALGKGPGYAVALDAAAIATGAIGIGLVALAALLREAVAMKSELDGFM